MWGNSSSDYFGTSASTGEISSDPLFLSASDYHLQGSSAATDADTDQSSLTTIDRDANPRPFNGGWGMGCYEDAAAAAGLKIASWREMHP